MWLSTPSVESITRPRLAVAVVSAIAAASIGYYTFYGGFHHRAEFVSRGGLHRSNAVRRTRRSQRADSQSSSSDEAPGDENIDLSTLRRLADADTVVDDGELEDGDLEGWFDEPGGLPSSQRAGHNIVNLLFRVSEDNARRNGCVHRGCQCNSCGMVPIRGVRYRCANCADFDLCETCESQGVHTKTHIFYKIRVPAPPFGPRQMQPVWYTGDPDTSRRNLPRNLISKLTSETGFERPELEAFWEQWTFMANTEWRDDPDELFLAMNRKTFERCLVPTGGSRYAVPNLIHDRMFAFYDSNKDGLIGFAEFLQGLSYRKRRNKLQKVFEGYDIDGDGYVHRKDFLRMFRAYYVLYKQMHKDILDGLEDQLLTSTEAQQLVASRQPLSSLFGREGRIPRMDRGMDFEGKTFHANGEVDVDTEKVGDRVIADNSGDRLSRQEVLTSLFAYERNPRGNGPRSVWVNDDDRPYLVTLVDPPTSIDDLADVVMGDHTLGIEDDADDESNWEPSDPESDGFLEPLNESEERVRAVNYHRQRTMKLDKRRRDMSRRSLHDRWRRRQFYLDEEEGGSPPNDWRVEEDIFSDYELSDDPGPSQGPQSPSLRPDSKVPFSSHGKRSVPKIAGSEMDAGKEILYQVTQQAFNELLDMIFQTAEDNAVHARLTRKEREKYKDEIDAHELVEEKPKEKNSEETAPRGSDDKPPSQKTLEELLHETGYNVDDQQPRNAVDLTSSSDTAREAEQRGTSPAVAAPVEQVEHRDPTLPQFLPNSISWGEVHSQNRVVYPITRPPADKVEPEIELTPERLNKWKRLTIAEQQAAERGGWGKISFPEFEEIFRGQEFTGNRLDYLGSWIDFCIP